MNYARSLLFFLFINAWGILIPIIFFPVFFIKNPRKLADKGASIWSRLIVFCLKKICKIDYQVIGLENLPKDRPFIIACKHQSMWETIIMHLVINRPVYAYKKELLQIPFYGWFVVRMSGIKVDRKGGVSSLKQLLKSAKEYLAHGQSIVIFPQGTRVPIGGSVKDYPYQSGIAALYTACNVPIVPASLNSGVFWGKKLFEKKSGTIILEFMKCIEPGLDRSEFENLLITTIEDKTKSLCQLS